MGGMSEHAIKVVHSLAGAPFGGAENFYTRLVCALNADSGLEQRAFTRANAQRVPQLESAGVTVETFRFGSKLNLLDNWRYRRALKRFAPDIVLTYMNRASGLTPRGDYQLVCRLGHYYDLKHYRHADYWIGISRGICQHLIDGGMPAERVVHIPNFVSEQIAEPIARSSFDTPVDVPLLFACGRLHTNKAYDILLQAMVAVPDAFLWLAGDGPERAALQQQASSLGVAARIRFLGWRNDINSLMRTADAYVCPSRHEGLGSIVGESWFNECPIVATDSQGPGELIEDGVTGLVTPVDEPEPLAAAINRVLGDRELATALAARAKAHYHDNYSQQIICQRYSDFFRQIAGR